MWTPIQIIKSQQFAAFANHIYTNETPAVFSIWYNLSSETNEVALAMDLPSYNSFVINENQEYTHASYVLMGYY